MINILDIFTGSVNKELMETLHVLNEQDGSLPEMLQLLLNDKLKVKKYESQANVLQHTIDILSWHLADTIQTKRDASLTPFYTKTIREIY